VSQYEAHDGVTWLTRALDAARRDGAATAATVAAQRHFSGEVSGTSTGETFRTVPVEGVTAIISGATGVVIGYSVLADAPARARPAERPRGPVARRKSTGRGPTTYAELEAWLAADGWAIRPGRRHRDVVDPSGMRVATISATPSDNRSLPNDVAALRRLTGLTLRRRNV
jgi:hypothetical protein